MGKKKKQEEYRVVISLRGSAAKQVDGLLRTGFYGTTRSKAAERVFFEGLVVKMEETKSYYRVVLQMYGYPAYVVNNLVGVIGNNKEEVLEQIVKEWLSTNWQRLSEMEITTGKAREQGYLPKRK